MALVNVKLLPSGSRTDMSLLPQGISSELSRRAKRVRLAPAKPALDVTYLVLHLIRRHLIENAQEAAHAFYHRASQRSR
jgi:hypothetical protein